MARETVVGLWILNWRKDLNMGIILTNALKGLSPEKSTN